MYQQAWHFPATTLTSVFAVYAVALLCALLVTGRLSDHVGRRPVIIAALVAECAGMGCFIAAHSVPLLYLARVLQGLATGAATGAISASLIELQPRGRAAGGQAGVLRRRPRQAMCVGCLLLAAGVAGTVVSIAVTSGTGFFLATAVAGFGFGLAFLGVFRTLSALAPPNARAGLIATIYVVSYLAFGLPVIAAGIAVTHIGLRDTSIGYGIVVAVLAAAAGLATAFMTVRDAGPAGHAELPPPGPCSVPMCLSASQPAPTPAAAGAPAGR
ncbi:MAG: MFS transporter [Trebonia sp.]